MEKHKIRFRAKCALVKKRHEHQLGKGDESLLLLLYQKFKVVKLDDEPNQMRMKLDLKMMYWVFATMC